MPYLPCLFCVLASISFSGGIWAAGTATVPGATIWQPSDNNTNYLLIGNGGGPALDFALFDYNETIQDINPGAWIPIHSGDQISFSKHNGVYSAINDSISGATSLSLGISNWFVIGAYDGSSWILDDGTPTLLGINTYELVFAFPAGDIGTLIQIDAKPVGRIASVVPAPAASLLLISGLVPLLRLAKICRGRSTRERIHARSR